MSTQAAFRAKGGRTSEDTGERRKKPAPNPTNPATKAKKQSSEHKGAGQKGSDTTKTPKIMPHESLAEFNRRVEATLRGGVSQAFKSAAAKKTAQENEAKALKAQRKKDAQAKSNGKKEDVPSNGDTGVSGAEVKKGVKRKHDVNDDALEFASAPGPRRLNDIAQAPPSLPKLKVSQDDAVSPWIGKGKGKSGLSVGQERLMEIERERVIKRYREMKAAKEEVKEKEREKDAAKRKMGGGKRGDGEVKVAKKAREYTSDEE